MRKRIISLVLAFCIVISLFAVPALAGPDRGLSGVWIFSDDILVNADMSINVTFKSNNNNYSTFTIVSYDANYDRPIIKYDETVVYYYDNLIGGEWVNDSYKTVDFGTIVQDTSSTFYSWVVASATQQAAECTHTNTEVRNATDYYTGDTYCADCDELISSGSVLWPVSIYDGIDVLYDAIPVIEGSTLTVTDTGASITDPDGNVSNYPCVPSGITGLTYLGLSSSANQTTAEYPVGSQIPLTGAADFYIVTEQLEAYSVNIYTINGLLVDTLEGYGDSTLTVNSTSLVLTRSDGTSVTYEISLGTDETFLGLSGGQTQSQYYGVDWPVGETISLNCSIDLYLVSEYPYPVAIYFNPGVVIKYFTGVNSCVVRVNETSVDFISHDGTVETLDIPLSGDDTFWGLALSPNQKTPTYRPGSIISIYDAKNFFIVRQSDYNKLVIEENTTDIGEDDELEADTSSLKDIFKDFKSFIKTNVGILRIIEIFRDENNYSWFTPETASQLDTAPSSVSTFSFDDVESDYEKYNMQAYDERLNLLMSFMGGDDE